MRNHGRTGPIASDADGEVLLSGIRNERRLPAMREKLYM